MKKTGQKLLFLLIFMAMTLTFAAFHMVYAAKPQLSKNKTTLYVGNTIQLKLTKTKQKIIWSSSKKKVATVTKNGKVKGIKKGKAVITAKIKGKKYSCKVTVKNIDINKSSVEMKKGEKVTLKILGNKKTIKWYADDNTVAEVTQQGVVTAKNSGITIVNAKIGKKLYCCVVVVKRDTQPKTTKGVATPAVSTNSSVPLLPVANPYLKNTLYPSKEENIENINFVIPESWSDQTKNNREAYRAYFPNREDTEKVVSGVLVGIWEKGGLTNENLDIFLKNKINTETEKMKKAGLTDISVKCDISKMEIGEVQTSFWQFFFNGKVQTMLVYDVIFENYLVEIQIGDVKDAVQPDVYDVGRNILNSLMLKK